MDSLWILYGFFIDSAWILDGNGFFMDYSWILYGFEMDS
jgi:hypothetical protein